MLNRVSMMPKLLCLARRTSISVGRYPGVPMRMTSPKKLDERRLEKLRKGWKENILCGAIHEMKLVRVLVHDLGDDRVLPHLMYSVGDVW